MEDLNAASLDDVKEWFRAYYGAANAVVVICGDVDTAEVVKKVEHYFGDIPAGPPVARPVAWIAKRTGTTRASVEERVPQAQVLEVWNAPQWGSRDSALLELAASVLARGQGSRLHARLVRKDGIATNAEASQDDGEIAGQFHVSATVADGADLVQVESVLGEEIARFLDSGPTQDELATEKTQFRAEFLRRTERVGGFGGQSGVLAYSELYGGRPDAWKDRWNTIASATPDDVRDAARRWLSDGVLVVETHPFPKYATAKDGADRSAMPAVKEANDAKFPALVRSELPNGLRVVLVQRSAVPLVRLDLLVDAGFAADPPDATGTAHLVGLLLDQGTTTRSAEEIRREVERLGAEFEIDTQADTTRITLSVPRDALSAATALLADVARNPSFPEAEVELQRRAQLAAIAQEHVDSRGIVQRVMPRLIYGANHPYAVPGTGTGSAAVVAKLTPDDLRKFHGTWFRPGSTTLVVTGDATMEELTPLVAAGFGTWEAGKAPEKKARGNAFASPSHVYLIDRPGAPQSVIVAAQLVPPRRAEDEMPLAILNTIVGGSFISRLNMNLREDKHWSYGVRSDIRGTRGQRAFVATAPVQTDKTAESLAEMVKEMRGIAGAVPATPDEIDAAKQSMTLTLPGRWEATRAVAESAAEIVEFRFADDYFDGYASRIRAVTAADVATAGKLVHPDALVWLVVGDRRKIEKAVRDLGVADVTVIDADGRPVE
jgi:zinc protease